MKRKRRLRIDAQLYGVLVCTDVPFKLKRMVLERQASASGDVRFTADDFLYEIEYDNSARTGIGNVIIHEDALAKKWADIEQQLTPDAQEDTNGTDS